MNLDDAAREAAREVLRCAEAPPEKPRVVRITTPLAAITIKITRPRRGRAPRAGPSPCEVAIVAALARAGGGPLTGRQVMAAMAALGHEHADTTVAHALAKLSRPGGPVTSSRRAPRGYRLSGLTATSTHLHPPLVQN